MAKNDLVWSEASGRLRSLGQKGGLDGYTEIEV